ncbi:LPS assembly lipoprotein LptE [Citreimonas salinaria]|nr:LPS assembly lipoprotein LptE [Citreimonas salinaria]
MGSGAAALSLAGCGFAPVYGAGGAGGKLLGEVALPEPAGPIGYVFNRRFEERLGRAGPDASYALRLALATDEEALGGTSAGATTRYRLAGEVRFTLVDAVTERILVSDATQAFTGYSATGSTVATLAARRDAEQRLAVLLADQMVDLLLLTAPELPR